jgi:maltoporin
LCRREQRAYVLITRRQPQDAPGAIDEIFNTRPVAAHVQWINFAGGTGNDQFRFREAFVQAGNILESQPGAKFWAGERFYRRQHIDIDDF